VKVILPVNLYFCHFPEETNVAMLKPITKSWTIQTLWLRCSPMKPNVIKLQGSQKKLGLLQYCITISQWNLYLSRV